MATAEAKLHVAEFTNEPFIDFSNAENRKKMEAALAKVKAEFGHEYPMWIAGQKVITTGKKKSTNPARPSEVIGVFQDASKEQAVQAVDAANKYFDVWKKVPAETRAKYLFKTAQIIRERKFELGALVCFEVGKSWIEADADVAETVDFCEYYGREMLRLSEPQKLTPMRGERNYMVYIPLGVGAVIPPWNFPMAIMAGLVVASLVTGNTVVLKPGADSPTIAAKFVDILHEAGVPKEAVQFLTGSGAGIGDGIVQHPKRRYIGLTGSKEGRLMTGGGRAAGDGYFVEPTIIADVDPKARLAQEEVFGPVLAVIKAKNFDHAMEIANNTEFGLTGAVYSKNPAKIKRAEEEFHVGNLYLNRKCTGAMVGAHPFGGFNMSGTDSKTGGKDYLLLFLQAKSVAEKV